MKNNLFLPEGRVTVMATLVSHWLIEDIWDNVGMEFITDKGDTFYYKGTGKLTGMTSPKSHRACEFSATFEKGELDGKKVSFAKRPTKIVIGGNKS